MAFELFAPVFALNEGLSASALQLETWNGVDRLCVAVPATPGVNPVNVDSVASAPQLVGFCRNPCLLISTLIPFRRRGTPLTIVGRLLVTTTRAVYGSTPNVPRVTTLPRLSGPATAGTTIESPNGAPPYGPVR